MYLVLAVAGQWVTCPPIKRLRNGDASGMVMITVTQGSQTIRHSACLMLTRTMHHGYLRGVVPGMCSSTTCVDVQASRWRDGQQPVSVRCHGSFYHIIRNIIHTIVAYGTMRYHIPGKPYLMTSFGIIHTRRKWCRSPRQDNASQHKPRQGKSAVLPVVYCSAVTVNAIGLLLYCHLSTTPALSVIYYSAFGKATQSSLFSRQRRRRTLATNRYASSLLQHETMPCDAIPTPSYPSHRTNPYPHPTLPQPTPPNPHPTLALPVALDV